MAAYVSVSFEKDQLVTSEQVRVIARSRDDGGVPPDPSTSYFPTVPNDLAEFVVITYVNSTTGDTFERIADLSDITTLSSLALDTFQDVNADFVAGGVQPLDTIELTLSDAELWTSNNYPSGNPFVFSVASVVSATELTVSLPFPAFANSLTWSIPARGLTGTIGTTLRNGSPSNGTTFKDSRYNMYFTDAVAAENFVIASKADLTSLVNESVGATLIDETVTIGSTI